MYWIWKDKEDLYRDVKLGINYIKIKNQKFSDGGQRT